MDETLRVATRQFETGKRRQLLSTQRVVFLVVAAAAPLAAMIANLPIALARGSGAGTPGAFLFAAATLLCFAVGYAAMCRRVVNTGAFYTYVALGLGKVAGVGAALTAILAYVSYTVGLAAFFGYFLNLVLTPLDVRVPWLVYAGLCIAVVAYLGFRSIDLSSKILGALMAAEIAVLAIFAVTVLATKGVAALPLTSFAPHSVLTSGLGVGLMIAFTSFVGFESAALYGEESREPTRSIPIAIYASLMLIGGFYLLTAWITVGATGPGEASIQAASQGAMLMFILITRYSGETVANATAVLVSTSLLASYLALHNAASRYIFALSREKLLPAALGHFHPTRYAPANASLVVSAVTVVCVAMFGLSRVDPYQAGVPVLIGFGTLGIVLLQGTAASAILVYLWRRRAATKRWVIGASGLGALGLLTATVLVGWNFSLLTASKLHAVAWLPLGYPLTLAFGAG